MRRLVGGLLFALLAVGAAVYVLVHDYPLENMAGVWRDWEAHL